MNEVLDILLIIRADCELFSSVITKMKNVMREMKNFVPNRAIFSIFVTNARVFSYNSLPLNTTLKSLSVCRITFFGYDGSLLSI